MKNARRHKRKQRRARGKRGKPMHKALAAARIAEERLRAAIDAMPEGVVFLDPDKRYILWNKRYAEIYAASADLFQPGAKLTDTLRIGVERGDYPEARGREDEWIAERLAKLDESAAPHEQRLADGRWILIEERKLSDGSTIGLRVDVTEMKQQEESFRLLFEHNPLPMFLYDAETRAIRNANAAAYAHYGFARGALIGETIGVLDHPDAAALEHHEGLVLHRRADGAAIEATVFTRAMAHHGRPCVLMACIDVTERRRAEARLTHMARHDALTGLPNRVLYREQVEARLKTLDLFGDGFAVLLFDLDNFKGVNDTHGHSVGDQLLQETARRIESCLGAGDMAARLGGDEFAVIHGGDAPAQSVSALAGKIAAEMKRPFLLDGQVVVSGASIGVAIAPEHGRDPERLLKSADLALYAAKAHGRGAHRVFEPEMDEHLRARRALEIDLRAALIKNELEVHYQPLIEIASGRMCGCEALLRWRHPVRGFVPPSEFVPIAEDAGLISAIGTFVLRQACADAAMWPDDMKVAVNLSPAQFRSSAILETVIQSLAASGLAPHRLDLEITEALLLERDEATLAALNGVRALGVGVSMDDFGTGYSSLIYLRNFPFTKIKIDKSFVLGLADSLDSQAIVRAILRLASSLGLRVLAEGVERAEDLAFLRQAGCQEAQGFYFSRAVPVGELFPGAAPQTVAPIDVTELGDRRAGSRRRDGEPAAKTA